jgi:hypothetical protein
MGSGKNTREWALLPQVTDKSVLLVEPVRIHPVRPVKDSADGVAVIGSRNKMAVVAHQAVRPDPKQERLTAFLQDLQEPKPILIVIEHVELTNSSMGYMVRHTWHHDTPFPWHISI